MYKHLRKLYLDAVLNRKYFAMKNSLIMVVTYYCLSGNFNNTCMGVSMDTSETPVNPQLDCTRKADNLRIVPFKDCPHPNFILTHTLYTSKIVA